MKAIQIIAPDRLELTEMPSRPLRAREVRIAVAATCLCGSDLKNIGNPVLMPQVPGHEFSGVVVEVSTQARDTVRVGDRVTVFPMLTCMKCAECRRSRFRDCVQKLSLGFQLPGSFAEEVIVEWRQVIHLTDRLTYEQGALVEHLCCGYRLAKEIFGYQLPVDSHIVIIGDGPIALADLQALRLFGHRNITLIGKHSLRMGMARKFGAARVLDLSEIDATTETKSLSLVDVIVMAASADETLNQLLCLLRPRGLVFPQTSIKRPSILRYLKEAEIVLGRAFAYDIGDFTEMMDLIKGGKVDTESLITNRIDLLELAEEFPTFRQKANRLKTVIMNQRLNEICESYRSATL